jgi:nicotinate-nucleotide adenylyltransferase
MNIGIFGGTFDPIHLGHLILAERCREEAKLDEVWFLPSYAPPHKQGQPVSRFELRCDMVTLATTGQPAFRVEPIEKELPPPSYTARTLAELHTRHPGHTFALIVGGDSVHDLPTWFEPAAVLKQAAVVAVARPGSSLPTAGELAAKVGMPPEAVRLTVVNSPQVDIAGRDIRQRVAEGKSVRFLVPRAVEEYIRERKLYRG